MSSKLESLIGKEGMTAFFTELKNALQTTEKTNEKSLIDFSIKGGENPSGSSIEIFSVDANQYTNYISEEKEYMNGAVTVITLFENLFNQYQGIIKEIPEIIDPKCPTFYILFPWFPVVFLFAAYFLKIKLDVITANFLSIALVFIVEFILM